jgi:hypothetical protein
MKTAQEIDATPIKKIRSDFFALMNDIVTEYGDKDSINGQSIGQEAEKTSNANPPLTTLTHLHTICCL